MVVRLWTVYLWPNKFNCYFFYDKIQAVDRNFKIYIYIWMMHKCGQALHKFMYMICYTGEWLDLYWMTFGHCFCQVKFGSSSLVGKVRTFNYHGFRGWQVTKFIASLTPCIRSSERTEHHNECPQKSREGKDLLK